METMLALGSFRFSISTAAYDSLSRSVQYRWASHDVVNADPVLHHTGRGEQTIRIDGTIYPEFKGGRGQIDQMRALAERGEALSLVTGRGEALGQWVIDSIEEQQAVFWANGAFRRQEFSVSLRYYGPLSGDGLAGRANKIFGGLNNVLQIARSLGGLFS